MITVNFQDVFVLQMVLGQVEQNLRSCPYAPAIGTGPVGELDFGALGVLCVHVEVHLRVVHPLVEAQHLIGGIVEI